MENVDTGADDRVRIERGQIVLRAAALLRSSWRVDPLTCRILRSRSSVIMAHAHPSKADALEDDIRVMLGRRGARAGRRKQVMQGGCECCQHELSSLVYANSINIADGLAE